MFAKPTAHSVVQKSQDENPRHAAKSKNQEQSNNRRFGAALTDRTNIAVPHAQQKALQAQNVQANQKKGLTTQVTAPKVPIAKAIPEPQVEMKPQDLHRTYEVNDNAMMVDEVSEYSKDSALNQLWEDIDQYDHSDPQAVTAYVDTIYDLCREKEMKYTPLENYMPQQSEINERMRAILLDWLVEVHLKFKLLPETLGLTGNLIDRFLSKCSVTRDNLQLVGITSMFLASKYEEIYPPECNDFVYISASAYTREQILAMEQVILNSLEFNLTVPTALHYLRRFSKAAHSDYSTHTLCKFFIELAMIDIRMNKYYPSMIAAAAVYLARVMKNGGGGSAFPVSGNNAAADWNNTLQFYTKYHEVEVRTCACELLQALQEAHASSHQAVIRKYSSRKFGEVAKEPYPDSI